MRRATAEGLVLGLVLALALAAGTRAWPNGAEGKLEREARRAILLAATSYGVPERQMLRVALCETGGTLNPRVRNPSSGAMGLFQFLPSTWARTSMGRAGISPYDPVANALAARPGSQGKRDGDSGAVGP